MQCTIGDVLAGQRRLSDIVCMVDVSLTWPKYVDDPERERVTGSGLAANTTYSLVDANWFLGVGKIRSVSSYPLS